MGEDAGRLKTAQRAPWEVTFRFTKKPTEPTHYGENSHVNPYGTFRLDMESRLDLDRGPASDGIGAGPDS